MEREKQESYLESRSHYEPEPRYRSPCRSSRSATIRTEANTPPLNSKHTDVVDIDELEEYYYLLQNDPVGSYISCLEYERTTGMDDRAIVMVSGNTIWALTLSTVDRLLSDLGFNKIVCGYGKFPEYIFVFGDDVGNEQLVYLEVNKTDITLRHVPKGGLSRRKYDFPVVLFRASIGDTYEKRRQVLVERDLGDILGVYAEVNNTHDAIGSFVVKQIEKLTYFW